MYSGSLFSQITVPTRTTPWSSTVIDNIFTNTVNESLVSGNLTFSISDHLAQFLIYPKLTINNKETIKNHNIKGTTKNPVQPNLKKN